MEVSATPLQGVFEARSRPLQDGRGKFTRLFCSEALERANGGRQIVQINHSLTHEVGAVRGLHFQHPPHAEGKWVRCVKGKVWDVAVDLRAGSKTFLQWHAVELTAEHMNAVFIPEGCAHGFQVLEADSELLYLHTAAYAGGYEGGVRWNDPKLNVNWPLPIANMSDRDQTHPLIENTFEGIRV